MNKWLVNRWTEPIYFEFTRASRIGTTQIKYSPIIREGKGGYIWIVAIKKTFVTNTNIASSTKTPNNCISNRGSCTNDEPPSGRIRNICEVIKVSDTYHRMYLRGYEGVKTRYQQSPKHLHVITLKECVEYYRIDWEDLSTLMSIRDRLE